MFEDYSLDFGSRNTSTPDSSNKTQKSRIKRHIDPHKERVKRKMVKKSKKINRKKK